MKTCNGGWHCAIASGQLESAFPRARTDTHAYTGNRAFTATLFFWIYNYETCGRELRITIHAFLLPGVHFVPVSPRHASFSLFSRRLFVSLCLFLLYINDKYNNNITRWNIVWNIWIIATLYIILLVYCIKIIRILYLILMEIEVDKDILSAGVVARNVFAFTFYVA